MRIPAPIGNGNLKFPMPLAAVMMGPDLGEFGAQQEYLRRIIDPDQQHDDAARRAIDIRGDEIGQVVTDQGLADLEQETEALGQQLYRLIADRISAQALAQARATEPVWNSLAQALRF